MSRESCHSCKGCTCEEGSHMTSPLKPCPFCGNDPVVDELQTPTCKDCVTSNGWIFSIDQWNSRPLETSLRERIEELKADNGRLRIFVSRFGEFVIRYCREKHWSDNGYVCSGKCRNDFDEAFSAYSKLLLEREELCKGLADLIRAIEAGKGYEGQIARSFEVFTKTLNFQEAREVLERVNRG